LSGSVGADGKDDNHDDDGGDRPARHPSTGARWRPGGALHRGIGHHPIGPHRPRDVLDLLLAHVLEGDFKLVAHLVAHHPADAEPARLGERFEPCGDIDPVAKNIVLVDDNVAEVDPDAEFDAPVRRHIGVALGHLPLDFDGTPHRVDDALKLDQQPVAGGLDDAAAMLANLWVDELAPMCLQPGERPLLIGAHQPAVAGDIGRQNGRQPSLDALAGQACRSR